MSSPASIAHHPIHPMLVAFPIGLWVFSFICDLGYLFGGHNDVWASVAFYSLMGGIIGAVAAAVPGLIDFFSIDEAAMRKLGIYHMVCNSIPLVIFGTGAWLRTTTAPGATLPIALSAVGVVSWASAAGWEAKWCT
jgi:uncharacterized membrane protein